MPRRFSSALLESGALMGIEIENTVELEGVQFGWPDETPLLSIERLELSPGERLFIHGPSGSGKSTLLGLIAGIQLPTQGSVKLLGTDLRAVTAGARDRLRGNELGFVFQQFNLVPYLSVLDNVLLPLTFARGRRERCGGMEAARTAAAQLLERLGIEDFLAPRRPAELSVGQQQRVAVARALLGGPQLIICDEPTSALDAGARDSFLDVLLAEASNSGAAILFVSHDAALASHFDRTVEMSSFRWIDP
jgi:putative ABC transport system ATP-binding protein